MRTRTARRRIGEVALTLFAAAASMLALPASAAAHAELVETSPADGTTVEGIPAEISATFSEPLDPDRSTFSLRDAAGERLAVGQIDPADPTRLIIDPVPEHSPGEYEVRWAAAGADGHVERDTWSFTVAAASTPSPTAEPTSGSTASTQATASATLEASPSPPPSPSASPAPTDPASSTGGEVVLPIVAALAIVLAVAALLLSRRGRPPTGV